LQFRTCLLQSASIPARSDRTDGSHWSDWRNGADGCNRPNRPHRANGRNRSRWSDWRDWTDGCNRFHRRNGANRCNRSDRPHRTHWTDLCHRRIFRVYLSRHHHQFGPTDELDDLSALLRTSAPPSFELVVNPFDDGPVPRFPDDWAERAAKYGDGITLLRSDQCPYIDSAVQTIVDTAAELDIPSSDRIP